MKNEAIGRIAERIAPGPSPRAVMTHWEAPTPDDMALFAHTIRHLAADDVSLGRVAVAHVIRNRVRMARTAVMCGVPGYSTDCTLAGVCREFRPPPDGCGLDHPGACDDLALACRVWSGDLPDPTRGAVRFHRHHVQPGWAKTQRPIALIGNHLFYAPVRDFPVILKAWTDHPGEARP